MEPLRCGTPSVYPTIRSIERFRDLLQNNLQMILESSTFQIYSTATLLSTIRD